MRFFIYFLKNVGIMNLSTKQKEADMMKTTQVQCHQCGTKNNQKNEKCRKCGHKRFVRI